MTITEITQFNCKQDMSRWTRAHADTPGINWSVYPGPGGTMIIVEHEENRAEFARQMQVQLQEDPADAAAAPGQREFLPL